jgi:acyl-CoA reductase-like NAD-dependent aldehyde dehydrogenase
MAGNAVVIKPSELTPLSALFGAEMARKAGFPENLLQVVNGRAATAEALIDRADMISFTGSVATGRHVMKRAAERLTPVSLELGGKDPMIVLKDADLERAAGACVWGALMNSGQACTSIERVYVEAPVYDDFLERVCDRARGVRQGPSEESFELGSMTSDTQLRKVSAQLEDAIRRGAKVLVGGKRNDRYPGLYFEPTVLANVSHEMRIMNEETFGPVIPIMKVNDASEAIRLANDSSYGLGASIFSRDRENALRMAEQLDCGTVCVNDALVNYIIPDAPMGGMKESGFGYRHGPDGIRKYCRQQTIVVDRFGLREEFPWYPNSAKKSRQLHHLLRLLCRSGWRNKWAALAGLMKA